MPRLLIVSVDPLSDIIAKGEIVARYYNPGDIFDDIHFMMLNDDRPSPNALAQMCGRASVSIHNLPLAPGLFRRSLGWQQGLMQRELAAGAGMGRRIGSDLVRTHGAGLNGLFANHIGRVIGRPVLLSLHNRPDAVIASGAADWLRQKALQALAAKVLRGATAVMAVYKAQLPYLARLSVRAELAYNMIASSAMPVKRDYSAGTPLRAITVGRQFPGKDIGNVIAAIAELPEVRLDVVGDGPLHDALVERARALGLDERVRFVKAMPNAELCASLRGYDLFVSHNRHPGVPKAVMEPMLAGLPVVMNRIGGEGDADLEAAAMLVPDTVEGYREALARLAGSESRRRELGEACRRHAMATWEPAAAEARQAALTRRVLEGALNPSTAPERSAVVFDGSGERRD